MFIVLISSSAVAVDGKCRSCPCSNTDERVPASAIHLVNTKLLLDLASTTANYMIELSQFIDYQHISPSNQSIKFCRCAFPHNLSGSRPLGGYELLNFFQLSVTLTDACKVWLCTCNIDGRWLTGGPSGKDTRRTRQGEAPICTGCGAPEQRSISIAILANALGFGFLNLPSGWDTAQRTRKIITPEKWIMALRRVRN